MLVIIVPFLLISCSSKDQPVLPGSQREIQDFPNPAIRIFQDAGDPGYHDIALAQTAAVRTIPPGQVWNNGHSCAAVSLYREDNLAIHRFKPVFRWLDSTTTPPTPGDGPWIVADRDYPDLSDADYRAVSCDAIYDPFNEIIDPFPDEDPIIADVELAVCYQVRGVPGSPINGDWEIGITVLQWVDCVDGQGILNFFNVPPTYRYDVVIPDEGAADSDELTPDIAYNHENGDMYLVYSDVQGDQNHVYVMYRRYDRVLNQISSQFLIQNTDGIYGHNGHDPSIDVGLVNFMGGTYNTVAVAYTSQFKDPDGPGPLTTHFGYHVCATAWFAFEDDHDRPTTFDLMHPILAYRDAGTPCIDISPNINQNHMAAIAYTQVIRSDGFGPVTRVFLVPFSQQVDPPFQVDDTLQDTDDGLFPSISINHQTDADVWASVTYLAQRPQSGDILTPYAARVQLNDAFVEWNNYVDINCTVNGNFNISDIPFQNPGVSSSIVTDNTGWYWAAWADRTEMEPPPDDIWASWGWTGTD